MIDNGIDPNTATEKQYEAALLHAMKHDTPMGYVACQAFASVIREKKTMVVNEIKQALIDAGFPEAVNSVLRYQKHDDNSIWVDYDPNSALGRQVARLMTDAVRPIIEKEIGIKLTFLNCCKKGSGEEGKKAPPTARHQFDAQRGPSFDC